VFLASVRCGCEEQEVMGGVSELLSGSVVLGGRREAVGFIEYGERP
jgi:hypothetical protein